MCNIVEEMTVNAPAVDRTRNPDHKGRDVWVTGVLSTVLANIPPYTSPLSPSAVETLWSPG